MTLARLSTTTDPSSHRPVAKNFLYSGAVLLILAVLFLPFPVPPGTPAEHTFHIQASSFAYSPATFQVQTGDRVTLELDATDVAHGIYLDGYNLEVIAVPGQTARLSFIADRPGTFRFRCPIPCGGLHPFMIGKLKVGTGGLFYRGLLAAMVAVVVGMWSMKR